MSVTGRTVEVSLGPQTSVITLRYYMIIWSLDSVSLGHPHGPTTRAPERNPRSLLSGSPYNKLPITTLSPHTHELLASKVVWWWWWCYWLLVIGCFLKGVATGISVVRARALGVDSEPPCDEVAVTWQMDNPRCYY